MKRFFTLLLGMVILAMTARGETKTITEDFNSWGSYSGVTLPNLTVPSTWAYVSDVDASNFELAGGSGNFYIKGAIDDYLTLITYAYAGENGGDISIDVSKVSSMYDAHYYIYKMIKSGDTYTFGDLIKEVPLPSDIKAYAQFSTVTMTGVIEKDCYIGIKFAGGYLDNYVNTYEEAAAVTKFSFSGVVSDASAAPLAGVAVELKNSTYTYNATTDAAGAYSLADVEAGTYTLTCTLAGYVASS